MIILAAALAVPAAAQQQLPFKGALQGKDADVPTGDPSTLIVRTSGTGIGTHIGQFSFSQETTVNFLNNTDTGSAHFTAANGDSIYTTIAGSGEFTDIPDVVRITEIHTITGGTGRFSGAGGSFSVERLANVVTFFTSGSFHGSITSPGAAD